MLLQDQADILGELQGHDMNELSLCRIFGIILYLSALSDSLPVCLYSNYQVKIISVSIGLKCSSLNP